MNRQRFTALVVAALLAISAAWWVSERRNAANPETPTAPLFPALGAELGTVTSLDIRKGAETPTVSLQRKGEQWTVAQRGDYPADIAKLRKLLLALSDAKIVEQKTADPANYAQIGVDDPKAPTALGTEVRFTAKDGAHSLIVGKPSGGGNFVRRGDEKTSYLAAPGIYVESEPRYWIEAKLLDIPAADISRIDYKPVSGAPYSVHRIVAPTPADMDKGFALDGVPPGRKAADAQALGPSPAVFGSISADDVAALATIDFSKPATAVITLKDGSVITLTGTVVGEKHWIEVSAPKNEALTARTAGRAFEIAGYRYDGFFRPLEQLLVPKETPAKEASAKPSSAAQSSVKKPAKQPAKQPATAP